MRRLVAYELGKLNVNVQNIPRGSLAHKEKKIRLGPWMKRSGRGDSAQKDSRIMTPKKSPKKWIGSKPRLHRIR